jgi:hypothetical protein
VAAVGSAVNVPTCVHIVTNVFSDGDTVLELLTDDLHMVRRELPS